jgi:hypothetical protein
VSWPATSFELARRIGRPKPSPRRWAVPRSDVQALIALVTLMAGCSSVPPPSARDLADANDTGQVLPPGTASERAILAKLPTLPSGERQVVDGTELVAEPIYLAASGRSCRAVHLGGTEPRHRVACRVSEGWAFVPDVFGFADGAAPK